MNDRERFINCMHYGEMDRIPFWDFRYWPETLERWYNEGLPKDVSLDEYFNMDKQWRIADINVELLPSFKPKILEENDNTMLVMGEDGVIYRKFKKRSSIPHYVDWTLKGRQGWEEYKKRLDPKTQGRYPSGWKKKIMDLRNRDYPLGLSVGSLCGWLRNWMGLENFGLFIYDSPGLFEEMVEYIADFIIETIHPALHDVDFDWAFFWEDIAFRNGPMISPKMFKRFLVPRYKKVTNILRKHNIDVIFVDCDGKIDELIPLWLEGGINGIYPVEIGIWQADPREIRKKFGKELLMIGGINKRILAREKEDIKEEIKSKQSLAEEGGYIPTPDHLVPPDVPFENYLYYLRKVKEIMGHTSGVGCNMSASKVSTHFPVRLCVKV